jgi:hypothetical protein
VLRLPPEREKLLEITFAAVFSAVIMVAFYALISMNGLVLGNDPAVHLEKAQIFLQTGKISLENLSWTPPLFQLLLAMLISLTGANSLGQLIFIEKTLAVIVDWLLFFSVYLIGAKFFNKKIGGIATVLLLFCFPLFEMNQFGGYTTVLGLAFMFLLFLYLPLATKDFGHVAIAFFAAFSLVLSHQLAMFVAVLILPPIVLYMFMKFRGRQLKALIAVILGGGIAFFLYYFQAMWPYLDQIIAHVFFMQKTTLYQIPATTLSAFMVNFGFVFILAIVGIVISFFDLKARKQSLLYLILLVSFVVPFVLAESHLFGLYLPFQWFIYYLIPGIVIFAAVSFDFAVDRFSEFYLRYKKMWKRTTLRGVTVLLIIMFSLLFVFRFGTVYSKIMEAGTYYSTSDLKAYDAGVWLKTNFPENVTVVATEVPGFWFRMFSGKSVIAATDPVVERNQIAESVLDLSYELEYSRTGLDIERATTVPLTLVRTYESKGDISDENYISINGVWERVAFSAADGDYISYRQDGVEKQRVFLSTFAREIIFDDKNVPKMLTIKYSNGEVGVTKTTLMNNDSYPLNVTWTLSPLVSDITNVSLYISTFFDLQFSFDQAYIPGILDWENPWNNPSDRNGSDWAVVDFTKSTLTGNFLGVYSVNEEIACALKFEDMPNWGNVGALASRQINAIRLRYDFEEISLGQTASFAYNVLILAKDSTTGFQLSDLPGLFNAKLSTALQLNSIDYRTFIEKNNIKFIVYDKNQLDTKIANCKLLELVYSNDRYAIFKIKPPTGF